MVLRIDAYRFVNANISKEAQVFLISEQLFVFRSFMNFLSEVVI